MVFGCVEYPVPFIFVVLLIALKLYNKYTCGFCESKRLMIGKTVIVTGANKGIGKETAMDLASRGARVILACRDLSRANAARDEIVKSTNNGNVVVQQLDLASLASVEMFAKTIMETEERLDVLINCAGVGGLRDIWTEDGFQIEMQTNYLGPFLLTNLLVDLLRKSSPSRIIFITSMCHHHGKMNLGNFNAWGKTKTMPGLSFMKSYFLYCTTKLANILNANHLALLLDGTGVTVNSGHPGAVPTDIQRGCHLFYYPVKLIFTYFCKTTREGAQTGVYLAVSEEVDGVTGKYFQDCKIAPSSADAQDKILAGQLWVKTKEMLENGNICVKIL